MLTRYRNLIALMLVLVAQLVLLAYQVKNDKDLHEVRIWTVTAVTPLATVIEDVRSSVAGFFENYFSLRDVRNENKRMHQELGQLKLENQSLKAELGLADRAKALIAFQAKMPSKMLAARIIGTGTGANNKVIFVDRGSNAGVQKGMGVVTPDGIVGKVLAAYPTASQVLRVDDPAFAAGVISQKNHVRGILRGEVKKCRVDYVQNEEKVEAGEQFFTSGEDRVFPKGMLVGTVKEVHDGPAYKDILLMPAALENNPEEVLVVLEGVNQPVPEYQEPAKDIYIGTDPDPNAPKHATPDKPIETAADKVMESVKGPAAGKPANGAAQPAASSAPGTAAAPPPQAAPAAAPPSSTPPGPVPPQ